METRSQLKSQITIINNGEEMEVAEDINDIENGGEIEGGVNVMIGQIIETEPELQTQSQQTKSVERGEKGSTIDMQARMLAVMEKLEDGMTKMKSEFKDIITKMESRFEDKITKMESRFEDKITKMESRFEGMENSIKEDVREMLAAFARDSEYKTNQRIESVNNEVKAVSERTHGQIQALTEVVRHNKSESNSNIESLRSDVTAVQAQIELQSHDVCERMSTFETRVTDLRVMTEQQQMKLSSDIEKMNDKVTNVCDELRDQLELLKNSNQEGNNGKDENISDVRPDNCRTNTSSGHASSTACIVNCNVDGHSNSGPQVKYVNGVGLGGSQQSCSLNNDPVRK
jgi:hypothetical protein